MADMISSADDGVSESMLAKMLDAMSPATEAPRNGVWVLYGDPGSGRTTAACDLGEKTLLLTCEKGYTALQNTPRIAEKTQVFTLSDQNNIAQIRQFVKAINAGQLDFDNIVLDTATGLYERKVYQSLNDPKHRGYRRDNDGLPSWPDYQWAFQIMRPMIFDLVTAKCMVTILCHVRYPTPELIAKGETTRPDLGKAVFLLINEECGIIGRTYRDSKDGSFRIRLQGSRDETCKSWIGMPPHMGQAEFVKFIQEYRKGM